MISSCHNSNSLPLSLVLLKVKGTQIVAIKSYCLIFIDDPPDPPAFEKGQMRFFNRKASDPPDPPYQLCNYILT